MNKSAELQIACRSCGGPTLDPGNGEAWCRDRHCPEGWGARDHSDLRGRTVRVTGALGGPYVGTLTRCGDSFWTVLADGVEVSFGPAAVTLEVLT